MTKKSQCEYVCCGPAGAPRNSPGGFGAGGIRDSQDMGVQEQLRAFVTSYDTGWCGLVVLEFLLRHLNPARDAETKMPLIPGPGKEPLAFLRKSQ